MEAGPLFWFNVYVYVYEPLKYLELTVRSREFEFYRSVVFKHLVRSTVLM